MLFYYPIGVPICEDHTGWNLEATRTLCEYHIPRMEVYASGDLTYRRRYWKEVMHVLHHAGFNSKHFNCSEKISRKWRYLYDQYRKVVELNNDKTRRVQMKFKYYGVMTSILKENNKLPPEVIDLEPPKPTVPAHPAPTRDIIPAKTRKRKINLDKIKTHEEMMRDIQRDYNERSLAIQREALELKRAKVELLKKFLDKHNVAGPLII